MKKYLFLFVAMLFAGVLFWNLTYFDFNNFHFYSVCDELFKMINNFVPGHILQYFPTALLLGVFTGSLVFVGLFFETVYAPFLILMLLEIPLYFIMPKMSFIFIGLAFAVGSLMLLITVSQNQAKTLKFSFFELSYQAINKFMRYVLVVLCVYNFVLIQNQQFSVPLSFLDTVSDFLQNSILKEMDLGDGKMQQETLDFNEKICEKEGVDKTLCLQKMSELFSSEDLAFLTQEMGYASPTELNLAEIINFQMRKMIEPYQKYLPYVLTVMFYSMLYFLSFLLVFIYTFLAEFIYLALLQIELIHIDVKEKMQEYLV